MRSNPTRKFFGGMRRLLRLSLDDHITITRSEGNIDMKARQPRPSFAVAMLLLILGMPTLTAAQTPDRVLSLDIPAQPLETALTEVARKGDLQILFAPGLVDGLQTTGFKGNATARSALQTLVIGLNVELIFQGNDTVVLRLKGAPPGLTRTSAVAQTDSPETAATEPATPAALEEVLVTAQKREQSLQDVPISMVVTSGAQLESFALSRPDELTGRVPNVLVAQAPASDQLYIRGVGSGINGGFEQSVGTFVDGVYHGRSRYIRGAFVDVERVEVLRGPQSTFFGNNAIGGAFSVTTRGPSETWQGRAQASYEFEGDEAIIDAAVGGPITDTLGIRIAGRYADLEGFVDNLTTGRRNPSVEDKFGRVALEWKPNDDWRVRLKGEAGRQRSEAPLYLQMTNCPPAAPFTTPMGFCASGSAQPNFEANLDTRRNAGAGERGSIDAHEAVLTVDRDAGGVTLTSVTGYTDYEFGLTADTDTTALLGIAVDIPEEFDQVSQEFRLASPSDARLQYLVGAYWQQSNLRYETNVAFHFLTPVIDAAAPALIPYTPLGNKGVLFQDEETLAAFGALTWEFTDRLSATAGLRWTESTKDARQVVNVVSLDGPFSGSTPLPGALEAVGGAFLGTVPHDNSLSRKDDDLIPSVNLQFEATTDHTFYGSYSQGFKAGGFDAFELTGALDRLTFEPETVDAYEVGYKGRWPAAALSLNLALFRNEYENLQQSVAQFGANTVFFSVSNVGGMRSQGVELDLTWEMTERWRATLFAAYLDAQYEDYPNGGCTAGQSFATPMGVTCVQDLTGEPPPFAPNYSGSLTVGYKAPLGQNWNAFWDTILSFSDEYDVVSDNDPVVRQPSWQKLDVRLGFGQVDGGWEFALLGKNLTDEITTSFGNDTPASLGTYWRLIDRPRSIALQARYTWQ